MNDRTSIVVFLAGGLTGAALALLLAPQSGNATRERMRRTLRNTADSARDLTDRVVERGGEIRDEAAHRIQEAGSTLAGRRPGMARGNGDEVAAT
jgi:gas vesicle protein